MIGRVDAAIIPTDVGGELVERARPLIEAGLPVFVDKPMVDAADDLAAFHRWLEGGAAILSTSCMRYAGAFRGLRDRLDEVGEARLIVATMMKSWERYGIHAVEAEYGLLPPAAGKACATAATANATSSMPTTEAACRSS